MEFDPERQELIEAVLEPLGAEQAAARGALESAVAWAATHGSAGGIPGDLAPRFRQSAPSFLKKSRLATALMAGVCAVVLWISWIGPQAVRDFAAVDLAAKVSFFHASMGDLAPPFLFKPGPKMRPEDDVPGRVATFQQARLARGGKLLEAVPGPDFWASLGYRPVRPDKPSEVRWQDLSSRDPERAAFHLAAALNWEGWTSYRAPAFPDEELAAGEKLEPDNGCFALARACYLTWEAGDSAASGETTFWVKDPLKLSQAIDELERASSLPRWDDHTPELNAEILRGWPESSDCAEGVIAKQAWLERTPHPPWSIRSGMPDLLLATWLETAAAHPDPEVLRAAENRFRRMAQRWPEIETNLRGRDFQAAMVEAANNQLTRIYTKRGEMVLASRYLTAASHARPLFWPTGYNLRFAAARMAQPDNGISSQWIGAGAEEAEAGRLAEYAMWERMAFRTVAGVLALAGVICLLAPACTGGGVKALPVRMTGALTPTDRLWIALPPLLLAPAVYFGCTRLLPGRDSYITILAFWLMLGSLLGAAATILFGSAALARWRLRKRGAALGIPRGMAWGDVVVALLALGFAPAGCGLVWKLAALPDPGWAEGVAATMAILPLAWCIVRLIRWLGSPPDRRLSQAALMRACAAPVCVAALFCAATVIALHAWDRHLTARMITGSLRDPLTDFANPEQIAHEQELRQALRDLKWPGE